MNKLDIHTIKKFPKIELHCHLDGSVSGLQVYENVKLLGINATKDEILSKIIAPEICQDLTEYLSCFEWLTKCLKNPTLIFLAIEDICRQAIEENIIYLELRFSPYHLSNDKFTMKQVVEAVIDAVNKMKDKYPLKIGIILCLMRGREESVNNQVIELANQFRDKIVGLDLAGNESKYPTKMYLKQLALINYLEIPFTIHAGETGDFDNIRDAILAGAKRIGHGIAAKKSEEVVSLIRERNITLEMCPKCNIQTKASKNWNDYPFNTFYRKEKLLVTINTDNRTVSNTSLSQEFELLNNYCSELNLNDLYQLTINALNASFLNNLENEQLKEKIETEYNKNFYFKESL